MCPILGGYGVRAFFNSCTRPGVHRVEASWRVTLVAYRLAS
jgi:hypothetical protein